MSTVIRLVFASAHQPAADVTLTPQAGELTPLVRIAVFTRKAHIDMPTGVAGSLPPSSAERFFPTRNHLLLVKG